MRRLAAELEALGGADIQLALEEIPVRSFILDRDGLIRWQSKSSRTEIGEGWIGRNWREMLPEVQHGRTLAMMRRLLDAGEPVEFSIEVEEADGRVRRREISAAPLRGGDSVLGIFGVVAPHPSRPHELPAVVSTGLTKRQLEILEHLAEGKSTAQIAEELYLSKTTVRNHVAHVLANLGVHTRVQAILAASRLGLIRMPEEEEQPPER